MGFLNTFSLIGAGKHAQKAIIPAFKNTDLAQLKIIAGSKNGISYQEAVESSEIDSVYIALPNSLHAQWVIEALNSNKNVICEKPICCTLEEAKKIIKAQTQSNKKLLEAFMYRYHPQHQIVKEMLSDGLIGKPRLFEAYFHYYLDDLNNIRLKEQLAGGAIFDVGCYLIDSCLFLFKDKALELAGNSIINKQSNTDEFSTLCIKFDSGLVANLSCATRMSRKSSYSIYGEYGTITVRDAYKIPKNKKGLILLERFDGTKKEIFSPPADHYQLMIDEFCRKNLEDNMNIEARAELMQRWREACLTI